MRPVHAYVIAAAVTIVGAAVSTPPMMAQQTPCLHSSTDQSQIARRRQALVFTRHVNTRESAAFGQSRAYAPLAGLSLTELLPQGFVVQLSADTQSYSFSVVDQGDACRSGFFSNQDGLIYAGQALQ
jgi:hypothetical protein